MLDLKTLRKTRLNQGLTQGDMAKGMDLKSRSTYTRMERGDTEIKANDIEKISRLLNKNVDYFFTNNCEKITHKKSLRASTT